MPDDDLTNRIETLEERLTHQESAIEEMTRTLLDQEQLLRLQLEAIKRLEQLVQSLTPTSAATPEDEPPPPHY
ncbi:MAG: SlyX family protein [Pseudomonadota bacterium]